MSMVGAKFKCAPLCTRALRLYSIAAPDSEYVDTPIYPPILDLSHTKGKERAMASECEEMQRVKTVEEKQIKLNMPRYFGFKCMMFAENEIPYDSLKLTQFITKTHLFAEQKLPDFYDQLACNVDFEQLKRAVQDAIIFEHEGYEKSQSDVSGPEAENLTGLAVVKSLNRILINFLSRNYPHLADTTVDIEPRVEAAWYCGGQTPPASIMHWRKCIKHFKTPVDTPINRPVQYVGNPLVQLRTATPLRPFVDYELTESGVYEVPEFRYDPRVLGTGVDYRRMVNLPGFFAGDAHQFGLLSYHPRGHLLTRAYKDARDPPQALQRQAILASFAWLTAQANFLGFTTYNDLTYPLANQAVITNGRDWSFSVYQLNTMLMRLRYIPPTAKTNLCWATHAQPLYGAVHAGRIVDFNDDVLRTLVKFYVNEPVERVGVAMTPYLSGEEQRIEEYADEEKRTWLEREYKFITSNRPRYQLPYEIYHWEKIYKIDHKRSPMDARRRPFELFQNPWQRRLNDRKPNYIPRKMRPDVKRHVGRDAPEFWP